MILEQKQIKPQKEKALTLAAPPTSATFATAAANIRC